MKKILGSIFTTILFCTTLMAGVKTSVDRDAVYSGERVNFTISIEGKNPKFPNLNKIGGYGVEGVSSSNSINIINGNYKSTTSRTYAFSPLKSLTIPSYKVSINGKEYNTKKIKINVVKLAASKGNDNFSISMDMDKNDVFVGEPVKLDVKFKYKLNAKADKINITEPKIEDFWIKKSPKPTKSIEGDKVVMTYSYLIFPQKSGYFKIKPIEADVGALKRRDSGGNFFNDPFFNAFDQTIQWRKYISNKLFIHVKPLPNNLEVYGSFDLKASVDTIETKANKPVNLTIKINGNGNIDDVKKFNLDIDNVVVYSDEPKVRAGLNAGVYGGVFTQKVALIADSDFTIPALKFTYYDKNLKKVVTKETKPIKIKVKGGAKSEIVPKLTTNSNKKIQSTPKATEVIQKNEISSQKAYLFLFFGFLFGILVSFGYFKFNSRKKVKKETPIINKIKKSKGDKELFELLLPYGKKDEYIKNILETLEENIYGNKKTKMDKKEIIQHFLDLD